MTIGALENAVAANPGSPLTHFALGKALHERGELSRAVASYRIAIELQTDFAAAHCNLGLAYYALGRLDESVASCRRALEFESASHVAHNGLGLALQRLGRTDEAVECYRRAIALRPDYAEALSNLGVIAGDRDQYVEAADCFRRAINLAPSLPEPHYNLGCALIGLSQVDDAILEFNAALNLNPKYWQAWTMSGFAFQLRGQLAVALEHCQRAIQLAPEVAEPHHRLGVVLREADRLQDGIAEFQKALALKPKYPEALSDLAGAYDRLGDIDAAIHAYRRAIDVDPRHPIAHCGLGIALAGLGRIEEAMVAISKAFEVKPDYEAARSAYLFLLNYSPKHDPQAIFEEHRKWARARAESLSADARPFENDRTPNRRLRIGYVSPDFKQHSVAFFLTPVLANHDHSAFEVYCYSDVRNPDPATHQLRGYADCWRDIAGFSDKQVANLVRSDHIDVLIDLAVHSGNNRLLAFARRAAPVQATWLGYAGTTGLSTMDYKITDRYLDPVGTAEGCHSEQLIRLPDCYFCYTPPPGYPEVSPLPALRRGFVTFAAFQNLAKVSLKAIELWAGLLRQVAGSQLALKGRGLGSNATRQRLIAAFADCGIGSERLRFGHWGTMVEYLQGFSDVDIALDTTPFTGGTTTCHALWMGIPVVTLAGSSAVGRVGASILHTLSLPSLIARTPEEFAQVGARLAQDLASLAALRAGLRSRMKRSPLMDAERFTRNIEATFTAMWQSWCRGRIQNPSGS